MRSLYYFNNAATSWPKPKAVIEAMNDAFCRIPASANRAGMGVLNEDVFCECRALLAKKIAVDNDKLSSIILAENATKAANIILLGFPWKMGAKVLVDGAAHNSLLRPLHYLQAQGILEYYILDLNTSGRVDKEKYDQVLKSVKPQMVLLTHASNVTGAVNDVAWLFKKAKENGAVTFLDVAQTMGVVDIDVNKMFTDLLVFTGHKYLMGPQGTGGGYIAEGMEIRPVFTGGTGVRSDILFMPEEMPTRLENGTPNDLSFAGLLAALRWHEREGLVVRSSLMKMFAAFRRTLLAAGVNVIDVGDETTPVVSFLPAQSWTVEEAGQILEQSFGVICRTGLHCAPLVHKYIGSAPKGTVRLSISPFTTEEEIIYACDAVRAVSCQSR